MEAKRLYLTLFLRCVEVPEIHCASGLGALFTRALTLALVVGRDFFPYVDSGQTRLHVRTPEGTPTKK